MGDCVNKSQNNQLSTAKPTSTAFAASQTIWSWCERGTCGQARLLALSLQKPVWASVFFFGGSPAYSMLTKSFPHGHWFQSQRMWQICTREPSVCLGLSSVINVLCAFVMCVGKTISTSSELWPSFVCCHLAARHLYFLLLFSIYALIFFFSVIWVFKKVHKGTIDRLL